MFGAIAKILYGSDPAEFESFYTVDESVARLNAVRGSIRASLTKEVATGAVSKSRVVLRRVIPFVGNSFKPHFVGQFEERDGGVVLVGRFTMHWVVKAFMTLWLGGCVAWTLFALSATVQRPEAWFFSTLWRWHVLGGRRICLVVSMVFTQRSSLAIQSRSPGAITLTSRLGQPLFGREFVGSDFRFGSAPAVRPPASTGGYAGHKGRRTADSALSDQVTSPHGRMSAMTGRSQPSGIG